MELLWEIEIWAGLWLVTAVFLIARHWRANRGVGLLFTYILTFGLLHWLAPIMNLLPWYETDNLDLVTIGLQQSTYAIFALAVGVEAAWYFVLRERTSTGSESRLPLADDRVVWLYLLAGAFLYAVIFPIAGRLPSLGAISAVGSTMIVAAVGLKCWNAWLQQRRSSVWGWLLASTLLPLITIVTQGFLGYGFAAMLTIFVFVASFYRPRWKVVVSALALGYLGLSVYVTYMRDRADIRSVVWSGGSLSERTDRIYETFSTIEWFDLYNRLHLGRIDDRLNQDYLVGAAVAFLDASPTSFANGSTFSDAALAIVPRIFWPDKPIVAGSGNLVSAFTGIRFAEGTSIGIGQVMECYVNFGTMGVLIGFFIIGATLVIADQKARLGLNRGDLHIFMYWFLPGLSILQLGGSLVEVTGSAAAALVVAYGLHRGVAMLFREPAGPLSLSVVDAVE